MLKILGFTDIMAGLLFLVSALGLDIPVLMLIFYAGYLILKGFIFILNSFDVGSIIDVGGGVVLFLTLFFSLPFPILISFSLFLSLKGGVSLLM